MVFENPGSLMDYAKEHDLEPYNALIGYSSEVDDYRRSLAENLGISLDDLHNFKFFREEELATEVIRSQDQAINNNK